MRIKKLVVEKLWNRYNFSINFDKQVTILIGKNGSGKTTILNLLNELLSNSRNSKYYEFKKIKLLSFNKEIEVSIEQKKLELNDEVENLASLDKELKEELKDLFDRIEKEITNKSINKKEISLFKNSKEDIDYIFLSTFDMEVKNRELLQKHYNSKSHIKTELDIILNDLITHFKLYLLNIKNKVEKIQKEFDKELEKYTDEDDIKGLQNKLLEKNKKIKKIYNNRDLFENEINKLFKDTNKNMDLNENNSIIFKLNKDDYLTPYQLSSGEKQILIIMLNIMLLDNKETILLMDEPEISLHVEWQRVFIETLLKLNPNLQIIIATHSPAIVSKNFRNKVVSLSNFDIKD